jgi:hypothetical protein
MGLRGAELFPFGGMAPLWRIERTLIDEIGSLPDPYFCYLTAMIQ